MERTFPQGSAGPGGNSWRIIQIFLLVGVILIVSLCITGCISTTLTTQNASYPGFSGTTSDQVQRVEIYHFHRTQQCYSCKTVGILAEETFKTQFQEQLESGKVMFGHINIELPENQELVSRFGPTGPSLWIGVYDAAGFHKEENTNVWYKIGNKDEYIAYLTNLTERRLAGDYT